jgi:hypothetical protein
MINGRNVPTAPLSSLAKAIKIMNILKQQICRTVYYYGER